MRHTRLFSALLAAAVFLAPLEAGVRSARAEQGAKVIVPRFGSEVQVVGAPVTNQVIYYDGTRWTNGTPSMPPSGAAGGDLGGTYPNPTVLSLLNVTSGMSLQAAYNGGASGAPSGAITLSAGGGAIAITNATTASAFTIAHSGTGALPAESITNSGANNASVLIVQKNPTGAQSGHALRILNGGGGGAVSGNALSIEMANTTGSAISIPSYTVTNSAPLITAGQLWNNVAVDFRAVTISITDTTSGTDSRILLLNAGAAGTTEVFTVYGNGSTWITNNGANNLEGLVVTKNPTGSQLGEGIEVVMGATTTGHGISVGMGNGATGSACRLFGGTQTVSAPPLQVLQTWNAGGVTFRGIECAVTDTASAAGSTLLRLRAGVGGVTDMFTVSSVGDVTIAGKLTVTGAIDPTSLSLTGAAAGIFFDSVTSTAAVSAAGNGRLRFVTGTGWQVSVDGGAYATLATMGALSLQSAYGNGATIATAGAVPIAFSNTNADTSDVLTLTKSPSSSNSGTALTVTSGANATSPSVSVTASGSGLALILTQSGSQGAIDATTSGTNSAATGTFSNTGANAANVLTILKNPASTRAGHGLSITMGGGGGIASGNGLSITMTNAQTTGAAISIPNHTVTLGSQPIFTATQTWNAAGIQLTGVSWTFSDTASNSNSIYLQLLGGSGGSTTLLSVRKDTGTTLGQLSGASRLLRLEGIALTGGSAPLLTGIQTWSNGATTFIGADLAISVTAAAAASRLFRIQGGASGTTERFAVKENGSVFGNGQILTDNTDGFLALTIDGTTAKAGAFESLKVASTYTGAFLTNGVVVGGTGARSGYAFYNTSIIIDTAILNTAAGVVKLSNNSTTNYLDMGNGIGYRTQAANGFGWAASTDATAAFDTVMIRSSAGVVDFATALGGAAGGSWRSTNGTVSGALLPSANGVPDLGAASNGFKRLYLDYTIDTTAGDAATINKAHGRFRKDATGASFVLTNDRITANSTVIPIMVSTTATCTRVLTTVPAAGSCTFTFDAAPTSANVDVMFAVLGAD